MSEALIQTAITARLRAVPELVALLADGADSITDYVDQDATPEDDSVFPYVTLGDDQHAEWDTDTSTGLDTDLQIHVWTRYRGRLTAKEIQAVIRTALDQHDLFVGGGVEAVLLYFVSSSVSPDPDGKTHHGIQTFHLLTDDPP